jgi:DNA-binding MarR family transcriptional regulator
MKALEKSDDALERAAIRFYERFADREEAVAAEVGLTPRQCHAIVELGEAGPSRMKALSERIGVTTGTMTVLADRLERLGMIERAEDPLDGRAITLRLTPAGTAVHEEHRRHHRDMARDIVIHLGERDSAVLAPLLGKAAEAL